MILHYMDLKRNPRLHKRLRHVIGFRHRERVELVLELLLRLLVDDGEVYGAPIGAVEDGGGADVEEDDGVAGAEVLADGPLDGEGALVAEVDGDADAALGAGCGGVGGGNGRGEAGRGRGGLDFDGREGWVNLDTGEEVDDGNDVEDGGAGLASETVGMAGGGGGMVVVVVRWDGGGCGKGFSDLVFF
ncbi:hypothetical protein RHMOL_Rhmol04G0031300 [Rhododendron molle]|uniref:Uncharacterized protein n=1 Tax=Rhododendron molle TaxID=49168 RepID=A0ACC0NXN5_RHOML|nr:hypothetical protein RHMOL_Rhmol04G0031300 [Rhododendron molle]